MSGKRPSAQAGDPSSGTLADLMKQAGMDLPSPSPSPEPPAESAEAAPAARGWPRRVVLRRTRKGRGGRTVTLIEGVPAGAWRKPAVKALKQALGTGAKAEGDAVVVQGDVVDRLADWLTSQGVAEIVRGS